MQRYKSFGAFMKSEFGFTVYKVNVDAGFTCPNRDGTLGLSGCIYCNNDSFRPNSCKPTLSLAEQIGNGNSTSGKDTRQTNSSSISSPIQTPMLRLRHSGAYIPKL